MPNVDPHDTERWGHWTEFFATIPCAAYVIRNDEHLSLMAANSSFYTLFGCTEQDMRYKYGNRFGALLNKEYLTALAGLARNQKDSAPCPLQLKQRFHRNGQEVWVHSEIIHFVNDMGSFFCCTSFDITDTHFVQQDFAQYRNAMEFIVNQANLDAFEYDFETGCAHVYYAHSILSPKYFEGQGACPDFVRYMLDHGIILEESAALFQEAFAAVAAGSDKHSCELRMYLSSGTPVWVRFTLSLQQGTSGKGKRALCLLENITQQKEAIQNYLSEAQFYQAILSEQDAYAQVDITADKILRIGGMWKLYNEIIDKITYSELIVEFIEKVVHPEDRKHYLETMARKNFMESFENGIERLGCEFRRIVDQNKMAWMQLSVHLFLDSISGHIYALLYIKNIDAKKKQEFLSQRNALLDQYNNVYHKKQAQLAITKYLTHVPAAEANALMVIELDDCTFINEIYGSKLYEQIVSQVINTLSRTFRKSDIIGRFGTNKFVVFLKDISNKEWVSDRLTHLYNQLHSEKNATLLSCSVGAVVAYGTNSYEHLLLQASTALDDAKEQGKGRIVFYETELPLCEEDGEPISAPVDEKATALVSELLEFEEDNTTSAMNFDAFLSEQGEMAYLVDVDTFDLICGNQAFYNRLGLTPAQCIGMKCYEAVHRRDTPCPFCSKANWSTDRFYIWKNLNLALEQEFLIKNKLVTWGGEEVMLALAIDISNDKNIAETMSSYNNESHNILSAVQHMSAAENLEEALSRAMEATAFFFGASNAYFWQRTGGNTLYECKSFWTIDSTKANLSQEVHLVNQWLEKRRWKRDIMLENPEAMLYHSFELYQWMKVNNIRNQHWVQVMEKGAEIGIIVIENSTTNFKNTTFLDSFLVFLSIELRVRNLLESASQALLHDGLTSLLSRVRYEEYEASYVPDYIDSMGVVIANFNNLKGVNNTLGFKTGNYYIIRFSEMLQEVFGEYLLYRLNGDEFLVIAPNIPRLVLEDKLRELEYLVTENGFFTVSMGYAWDNIEKDLLTLTDQATQAMKINKKRFYDSHGDIDNTERRKMLSDLVSSLENREFEVFLQPKVLLETGEVFGAEALIRYRHKKLGIIPPSRFVEALEKSNLIRYIDLFVFGEVCAHQQKWKKANGITPVVSLNFSRQTLQERDIRGSMESIISQYDIARSQIEVEITESVATMGKGVLYQTVIDLRHAGYCISLDDFGTKYTNLSILADMDFNVLKIDRSLVNALETQANYRTVLKNVIQMCSDLNISVIAEGVETKEQEKILLDLGCKYGQGYLYGKPMPIHEFEEQYIASHKFRALNSPH